VQEVAKLLSTSALFPSGHRNRFRLQYCVRYTGYKLENGFIDTYTPHRSESWKCLLLLTFISLLSP
jgi:hypothetical protein